MTLGRAGRRVAAGLAILERAFSVVHGFGEVCLGGHDQIGTGLATSLEGIPHRSDVVRRPRSARSPAGAAFPHDATAEKHTLATLGAKLEVLMRLLSLGYNGKQHGG
jgi:hypothetical protein